MHMQRIVDRAANGEEIVISKHGTPVAKLVPLTPAESAKPLAGCMTVLDSELELDASAWEAQRGEWLPK
jgi:prevent-host-death family protein